jgi:hypothetical protein
MTAWLKLVELAFTDKAALTAHVEGFVSDAKQVQARRTAELHAAGLPASIEEMKALPKKKPAVITAGNKKRKR